MINFNDRKLEQELSSIDSILRTSTSTEQYIKYILTVINDKLFNNRSSVTSKITGDVFHIYFKRMQIASMELSSVEKYRKAALTEFERFIIEMLKCCGCSIDENNAYYTYVILNSTKYESI